MISQYPHIHQFLDDSYIRKQCGNERKNYLLERLTDENTKHSTFQHLPRLEQRLARLETVSGYCRLKPLLRGASNWDEYQEFLTQIDITLWFQDKGIIRGIEPKLPQRIGNTDILLSFSQEDIYCEVTSLQSLLKMFESKTLSDGNKIQRRLEKLKRGQPWLTKQHVENEIERNRIIRNLLDKTRKQLPSNHPGILALDTTKSAKFTHDVKLIAEKLLPQRPQIMFVALWSWEGFGEPSWEKIPSYFYINSKSEFRKVGETLLEHLGLKRNATVI